MWRLKIEEKCPCQEFYRFFLSGLTLQCFQQCATNKLPASIYSTIHEYHAVVCILHRIYCTIQCLTETVMLWLTWPLIGWFIQCVSGYSFTLFLSYSHVCSFLPQIDVHRKNPPKTPFSDCVIPSVSIVSPHTVPGDEKRSHSFTWGSDGYRNQNDLFKLFIWAILNLTNSQQGGWM